MGIEVSLADDADIERWNDYVERSPHGSVFHRYDFLRVLADHSGGELYPLIGYKGQEPVGLFPVFELKRGPVSAVFSPPPQLGVPHLGPALLNYEKLKQRKREKLNKRFVEGSLDWVEENVDPGFVYVLTSVFYDDVRPFQWNDFDASPLYTYEVDLSIGEADLLKSFARDARKPITDAEERPGLVEEAGDEGIEFVVGRINDRYDESDGGLSLNPDYLKDLSRVLDDVLLTTYVASLDDEPVSGQVVLTFDGRRTMWQGSPKPNVDLDISVNDVLMWHAMTTALDAGATQADLVGANTERISRYKSKFNPKPAVYYELERGSRTMNVVSDLYRRFR